MRKFLYLLLLLLPVVCDAAADNYHLVRILVRGSKRYSEADDATKTVNVRLEFKVTR